METNDEDEYFVCENCGEKKPDVKLVRDPFLSEVYDEEKTCYLCDDCYDKRHDEV